MLPYLNAVLGGFEYLADPPAVTLRAQGKLITVHGDKIAINAVESEAEAQDPGAAQARNQRRLGEPGSHHA